MRLRGSLYTGTLGGLAAVVAAYILVAGWSPAAAQGLWRGTKEQRSQKALAEAEGLAGQGKHTAAEKAFREAIKINPNFVNAYRRYSLYLYGRGRYEDATKLLQLGIKLNPYEPELRALLGMQLCRLGKVKEAYGLFKKSDVDETRYEIQAIVAQCAITVERWGEVARAIRNYLKHRPDSVKNMDPVMRVYLAMALLRSGLLDDAARELDAATKQQPGLQLAGIVRGELLVERGDCRKALDVFSRYLSKTREREEMELRIGRAYLCMGRAKDSLKIAETVLRRNQQVFKKIVDSGGKSQALIYGKAGKNLRQALFLRGNSLAKLKKYDSALQDYNTLVKIEGKEGVEVVYRVAQAYFHKGRYGEVLTKLSDQLQQDDTRPQVLVLALRAAVRSKKLTVAQSCADRLLKQKPVKTDYYYYAGIVSNSSGRFQRASELFESGLAIDPKDERLREELVTAYAYQGKRALGLGRNEEALAVLRKAEALSPRSPALHVNLALTHLKRKDYKQALLHANVALKAKPKDPVANWIGARALALLGEHERALGRVRTAMREAKPEDKQLQAALLMEEAYASVGSGAVDRGVNELEKGLELLGSHDAPIKQALQRNLVRAKFLLGMSKFEREPGNGWNLLEGANKRRELLPEAEQAVVAAGTLLGAITLGKGRRFERQIRKMRAVLTKAVRPELRAVAPRLFEAYAEYRSDSIKLTQRGAAALERLAQRVKEPARTQLMALVANAYEQVGYRAFRYGKSRLARTNYLKAGRVGTMSPKVRHNLAVASYYSGRKDEALAALQATAGRVPQALCNLAVHHEMKGAMLKSYDYFRKCAEKKVRFRGLREIIDIKRQIFGR